MCKCHYFLAVITTVVNDILGEVTTTFYISHIYTSRVFFFLFLISIFICAVTVFLFFLWFWNTWICIPLTWVTYPGTSCSDFVKDIWTVLFLISHACSLCGVFLINATQRIQKQRQGCKRNLATSSGAIHSSVSLVSYTSRRRKFKHISGCWLIFTVYLCLK